MAGVPRAGPCFVVTDAVAANHPGLCLGSTGHRATCAALQGQNDSRPARTAPVPCALQGSRRDVFAPFPGRCPRADQVGALRACPRAAAKLEPNACVRARTLRLCGINTQEKTSAGPRGVTPRRRKHSGAMFAVSSLRADNAETARRGPTPGVRRTLLPLRARGAANDSPGLVNRAPRVGRVRCLSTLQPRGIDSQGCDLSGLAAASGPLDRARRRSPPR
jgi:hypothetical protein